MSRMRRKALSKANKRRWIEFEEDAVKEICVNTYGDGNRLSKKSARNVTVSTNFFANKNIITFNEYKYFTGLTYVSANDFRSSKIEHITFPVTMKNLRGENGLGLGCFSNTKLTEVDIRNITEIGSYVFYFAPIQKINLRGLKTLSLNVFPYQNNIIEVHVNSMDDYLRYNCGCDHTGKSGYPTRNGAQLYIVGKLLEDYTMPDSYTAVPNGLFGGAIQLINFGFNNCKVIGNGAFYGCKNLQTDTLPENLTSIGDFAFQDCVKITVSSLPETITSIGQSAFRNCPLVTFTSLPSLLKGTIGSYTFYGCKNARIANIPSGITTIGNSAFYGSGIAASDMSNVTSIEYQAFYNCKNLQGVSLPKLTTLGKNAFYGCSNLYFMALADLKNIPDYVFQNCTTLTIPDSVRLSGSIATYVFDACSNLVITDDMIAGVTSIGTGAFRGCKKLLITKLPIGVKAINSLVFNDSNLKRIRLEQESMVTYAGSTNSYVNRAFLNNTQIYVPDNLVDTYKNDANWSKMIGFCSWVIKPLSDWVD